MIQKIALAICGVLLPLSTTVAPAEAVAIQVISGTITEQDGSPAPAGEVEFSSPQIKDKVAVGADGRFNVRAKPGMVTFTYRYIVKAPTDMSEYIWAVYGFTFMLDSQTKTLPVRIPNIENWRVRVTDSRGNSVGGAFLQVWGFSSDPVALALPQFEATWRAGGGARNECYVTMGSSGVVGCPYFDGVSLSRTSPTSNCQTPEAEYTLGNCHIGNLIYKPEPDLTLKYALYLGQVDPTTQTVVTLDDVPTLALAAPAAVTIGSTASISLVTQNPIAPQSAAVRNRANRWVGKTVTLMRRDFVNPKKPGKWVKAQTLKLNSKRAAKFKVAVPRTSQYKVVTTSFSAGSAIVTVRAKK